MVLKAIVGTGWGDEGKGRLTDELSEGAVAVARYCGANNAGHALEIEGKRFCTTILPSGVLRGKKLLIGSGVCTDPLILLQEIQHFEDAGFPVDLLIDYRTPVTLPHHRQRDGANERMRGKSGVGSVGFGAGYSQADRTNRLSVRMVDLLHEKILKERIENSYRQATPILKAVYGEDLKVSVNETIKIYSEAGQKLKRYIGDVSAFVQEQLKEGKTVLCESSQGLLLDLDFGTWPYTTGTNLGPGRIFTGLGIPIYPVETLGIVKAFSSRAGWGPFPTKFSEDNSVRKHLIEKGNQYEVFPGYSEVAVRHLDVGYLDGVALKTSVGLNLGSGDKLALTHLDTLAGLENVCLAVEYVYPDGSRSDTVDISQEKPFAPAEVIYKTMHGWDELKNIKVEADLPKEARAFIDALESFAERQIRYLSFSPRRDDLIDRL